MPTSTIALTGQFYLTSTPSIPLWDSSPTPALFKPNWPPIQTAATPVAHWTSTSAAHMPSPPPCCMTMVSDGERMLHANNIEFIWKIKLEDVKRMVDRPQTFVYTIGRADEGAGLAELRLPEVEIHFNPSLVEKAMEVNEQ